MIDYTKYMDTEMIIIQTGVQSGESILVKYTDSWESAPEDPGTYTLWELIDPDTWDHVDYIWEKEE